MGIYTERNYTLEDAKNACAPEIESWYGNKVLDVFDSSALGPTYRYYCSEADQLRMINGRVSNTSVDLMCGIVPAQADSDPQYNWIEHSSTEAGKVHTDYVRFSRDIASLYGLLKQELVAATTVEQVEQIFYQLV